MIERFELEKRVWTDMDFEQMGWHDCRVYGIKLAREHFEIAFVLDYIFKWGEPSRGETYYKFWISPATLVFESVYDIKLELGEPDFEIDFIERTEPRRPRNAEYIKKDTEWIWSLEAHRGALSFRSVGYQQFIRKLPVLSKHPILDTDMRGGISFDRCLKNDPF